MTIKEKIIAEISSYIGPETEDTLLNHFKIYFRDDRRFYGIFTTNGFKIWRCSKFLNGVCYPVAIATFDETGKKFQVNLKTKMNSGGLLFAFVILLLFGVGGFIGIKGNNDFIWFLKNDLFLWLLFMSPFSFLFIYMHRFFSKEILNQVEGMIRDAEKR